MLSQERVVSLLYEKTFPAAAGPDAAAPKPGSAAEAMAKRAARRPAAEAAAEAAVDEAAEAAAAAAAAAEAADLAEAKQLEGSLADLLAEPAEAAA